MSSKRWCIGITVVIVVAVALGLGLWFGLYRKTTTFAPGTSVLIKTNQGLLKLYDPIKNETIKNIVAEYTYGITGFDYYMDKTIYYGTTRTNGPILSSNKEYNDISDVSIPWAKTALAVDYVSNNLYVIDRVSGQLNVISMTNSFYNVMLRLENPQDILLDPHLGLMFILQSGKLYMAYMDGTNSAPMNSSAIDAFAIDRNNTMLYYVNKRSIEKFDYINKRTENVGLVQPDIQVMSMSFAKDNLFFVGQKQSNSRALYYCYLQNGKCEELKKLFTDPTLQSAKVYDIYQIKSENPCENNNGNCQHLCIRTHEKNNYSCACNENWKLNSDLRTCSSVKK